MSDRVQSLGAETASAAREERLPLGTIFTYALPTIGAGYMFLLVGLYLMKFATDVLLIAPAAMSAIFGLSRVWDAISDPIAGYFSDRTHHRAGRRRPWIFVSSVPIGVAFVMAFAPPQALEGGQLVAWMAVGVFGFYSAMTIFIVPHMSLGAELTTDYHDRSRIFGVRHAVWTIGSILSLVGMTLLIEAEAGGEASSRQMARQLALFAALATGAMILFASVRLRERPEYQGRGGAKPFRAFADVWRNPHARLLVIVTFIEHLGAATIGILTLYVAQYVVGTPHLAPLFILCYMIPSFASVPIWLPLSRRFGKKALWMFSMVLTAFSFGGMFFLEKGSVALISGLAFTAGLANGCGGTVSPSVQTDVIDYDEYITGERKEGAYFSAWNFVFKLAFGVTLFLTGFVLQFSGYVPNAEQTETVKTAILALYALYPLTCFLIGAAIFSRFRLNEKEHGEIRAALDARKFGAPR
ncbi:MAG: glycoside-pentoside-hexuronide (GPH):cation symporter [Myxococcota bacterium]